MVPALTPGSRVSFSDLADRRIGQERAAPTDPIAVLSKERSLKVVATLKDWQT